MIWNNDNHTLMDKAKELIDDYCFEEFRYGADFSDLSDIGIGFTETDEGYPIQAIVDLNQYKIETTVMGVTTYLEQYDSLEDLVYKGLPNLDFSELTYVSEDDIEKITEMENEEHSLV